MTADSPHPGDVTGRRADRYRQLLGIWQLRYGTHDNVRRPSREFDDICDL